jgi:hypothetical protein
MQRKGLFVTAIGGCSDSSIKIVPSAHLQDQRAAVVQGKYSGDQEHNWDVLKI